MNEPLPSSHVIVFRTWKITPRSLWNPLPNVLFDVVPLVHTTLPSDVNTPEAGSNCSTTVKVVVCGGAATAGSAPSAAARIATRKALRRIRLLLTRRSGARQYADEPPGTSDADDMTHVG